jgi:GPH family glycoside/pentoside/hexuronide:cation symporter
MADETWQAHARYGALGLPLAFVALPLYVIVPAHYGGALGVPLAALGGVLLASRLLDAVADPLLGRWADRLFERHTLSDPLSVWRAMSGWALVLALGCWALFFPAVEGPQARLWWCAATMSVTCLAMGACTILHQAWGTRLGGDAPQRARWVAWREGLGIVGVVAANALATTWGVGAMVAALSLTLLLGLWALRGAPQPRPASGLLHARPAAPMTMAAWLAPWRLRPFRHLMWIYLLNGAAGAVPATLVLFFVQDLLGQAAWAGAYLGLYFVAGAVSVPAWLGLIRRLGPSRAWALGMLGNIAAFAGVLTLQGGDLWGFALICLISGFMLGADLTAPGTLLAGVIQQASTRAGAAHDGLYTGWWQWVTKLNLALAAGVALPALAWLGYQPGHPTPEGLMALSLVYGAVPCLFKALALLLWWRLWARHGGE